ncbi:MAG: molecular chaperone HtpG [Pseudobdellovibrionaceae bacterium]
MTDGKNEPKETAHNSSNSTNSETQVAFQAEIQQLLDLMIHSLYSQKEIFLRELISNSSDALDKLKFLSLTQPGIVPDSHPYQIRLEANPENHTLKIIDTGIGMSRTEVQDFIGTIAKSGTKKFQQINQEMKNSPELIGQFGVGFYASFMVADKILLHTQKPNETAVLWQSEGKGSYQISEVPRAEGVGTTITLTLKKFADEEQVSNFTDTWVLKDLVKKYSDFVPYPILMKVEKDAPAEKDKAPEKIITDETLNSQKALWLKSPSEVTTEEYKDFYQHLTHDWNEPLKTIHYRAEGSMEFTALLFIPKKKPFSMMQRDQDFGLNLYVRKVFIMNEAKDLILPYLRFMKGMVDSSDLSLNVSREILQQDKQVTQIRKNIVGKILGSLKDLLAKDRTAYENFWTEFGYILKEGIPTDIPNLEKLKDLVLFHTSSSDKLTTLAEYVERMKPDQKAIYFISGDDLSLIKQSPYLEKLNQKGFEVLYLVDQIDEWVTQHLTEYNQKPLKSVMKENLDLENEDEKKQKETHFKELTEKFKDILAETKEMFKDEIKDVKPSDRLIDTPACLIAGEHDPSVRMEKIYAQMDRNFTGQKIKRVLEVNLDHPVFQKLLNLPQDQRRDYMEIIYSQALLFEGSPLPNPAKFTSLISKLMLN